MIFWLVQAVLFNLYFIAIRISSPETFFGSFFGFSSVWFWLSVVCFLIFCFRKHHFWKKTAKWAKIAVLSVFCAGILVSGINLWFICHPKLADGSENPEYVILLGGGITKDAELTDSVKRRVAAAVEYLKAHPDAVCVVTGGKGVFAPCPESDVLKPAVESFGIAENRVLAENQAKDTIQNFQFSAKILSEYSGRPVEEILAAPVAIVTNDFHLARAERLAERMGFSNFFGVEAKTPPLFILNSYSREILCYIKLNLRILLTGKPEKIL